MKTKLIIASLATLTLAGCAQDEVLENESNGSEIGFTTFVDNSTRADETTILNLTQFKVWATKAREAATTTDFVTILNGASVTKGTGGVWSYSPTKYWVAENAYSFTGIGSRTSQLDKYYTFSLPTTVESGKYLTNYLGTLTFNNSNNVDGNNLQGANAKEDMIWASTKVPTVKANPGKVSFNFKHLLSRVNVKFVNSRTIDENITIDNVQITSAATGTLDFTSIPVKNASGNITPSSDFTWQNQGSFTFTYDFTNPVAGFPSKTILGKNNSTITENRFLLPSQSEITVSFDVYTSLTGTDHINITKKVKFPDTDNPAFKDMLLRPGYSYTLIAYIDDTLDNLGAIEMVVASVEGFKDAINVDYLWDVTLTGDQTLEIGADDDGPYKKYVDVTAIIPNPKSELVIYGKNPQTFVPADYAYEWSISNDYPMAIGESITGATKTKTYALGTVTDCSQLSIPVIYTGKYSDKPGGTDVSVTLTVRDSAGNVVVVKTTHVILTQPTTGGSQDGNDNDT